MATTIKKRPASDSLDDGNVVQPISPPTKRARTDREEDKGSTPPPIATTVAFARSSAISSPASSSSTIKSDSDGKSVDVGVPEPSAAAGSSSAACSSDRASPLSVTLSRQHSSLSDVCEDACDGREKERAGSQEAHPMAISSLLSPSPPGSQTRSSPPAHTPTTPKGREPELSGPSEPAPSRGTKPLHVTSSVDTDTAACEIARLKKELAAKDALLQKHEETFTALQASLQCQICYEVMYDPYITSCGHTSCRQCLSDWFRAPPLGAEEGGINLLAPHLRRKTCPTCRAPVKYRPTPIFIAKNILASISDYIPPEDAQRAPAGNAIEGPAAVRHDPWAGIIFGGNDAPQYLDAEALNLILDRYPGAARPQGQANPGGPPPQFHPYLIPAYNPAEVQDLGPAQGILNDHEDRVQRCMDCLFEVVDGMCEGCGRVFPWHGRPEGEDIDDDGEDEEDDFLGGRHWFHGDRFRNQEFEEDEEDEMDDGDEDEDGGSFIDDEPIPQWDNRDRSHSPRQNLYNDDDVQIGRLSDDEGEDDFPARPVAGRTRARPIVISDDEDPGPAQRVRTPPRVLDLPPPPADDDENIFAFRPPSPTPSPPPLPRRARDRPMYTSDEEDDDDGPVDLPPPHYLYPPQVPAYRHSSPAVFDNHVEHWDGLDGHDSYEDDDEIESVPDDYDGRGYGSECHGHDEGEEHYHDRHDGGRRYEHDDGDEDELEEWYSDY